MAETLKLPLLPLRGMVVFPYMIIHLDVGRDRSVAALDAAMVVERKIFLLTQMDAEEENPTRETLYEVGTIAEIRQLLKMPDGSIRVLVEGVCRATLEDLQELENYAEATIEERPDRQQESMHLEALTRGVVHEFEEWVKLSRKIPAETFVSVTILDDVGRLCDLIASHLNLKLEVKQDLLSCLEIPARLEKLYGVLMREMEVLQMEQKIGQRVRSQMEKFQRDYYLREQLKAIHLELGDDEDRSEEIAAYEKRLEKGKYPEEVKKAIRKELRRMDRTSSMAQELGVIRSYVDCLMELPWEISTKDSMDLEKAQRILDHDHYGLEKVKERILIFWDRRHDTANVSELSGTP